LVAAKQKRLSTLDAAAISIALNRLASKLLAGGLHVQNVTRLSGGASQETWAFDVLDPNNQSQRLILRRCPIEGPRNDEAIGLAMEARLLQSATQASVLVPPVVHVCTPDDGLGDALIMGFVRGETLARKILRDAKYEIARTGLASQCGTALAKIHSMPKIDALPVSNGLDQLARYRDIFRGFNVNRPVIELAFTWLAAAAPNPIDLTLVHGDFRNGNVIVGEDGLRAVLDWELAHIGDPREDLGWICVNSWRFGQSHKPVGGFGDLDAMLGAYVAAGGQRFDVSDIKWFQALGSLKWAIMCLIMYQAFEIGADPSIERAMIGRRTSEAEIDLLNLMEGRPYA
jgi:aminoglycoside phosphotransferase (APT) family kinase protein